eukprot:TRINITY_DN3810_c1_g1_i2.p1 TRINITY_DN3810_c1_g1~~TRINITY_DN3810_c1_g1_i2.p1  ORF type:complete len:620 (+),score=217.28 TRINITY_DN3810_c1_g1_i2:49-1860(+)
MATGSPSSRSPGGFSLGYDSPSAQAATLGLAELVSQFKAQKDEERRAVAHMSFSQLQAALAHAKEACGVWRDADAAAWKFQPQPKARGRGGAKGGGRSSGRGRGRGGSSPANSNDGDAERYDEDVEAALVEVSDRDGLEQLLAAETRLREDTEANEQQIRVMLEAASKDSKELCDGLPELLAGRKEELQKHLDVVNNLKEGLRQKAKQIRELNKELGVSTDAKLVEELEVEAWPKKISPVEADGKAFEKQVRALEAKSKQIHDAIEQITTGPILGPAGAKLEEHLKLRGVPAAREEADRLHQELADLHDHHGTVVEHRGRKSEAAKLAAQIEVEGLERSLALRTEHLQAKEREAEFWRQRSELLTRELEKAKAEREIEQAARLKMPLAPGPAAVPCSYAKANGSTLKPPARIPAATAPAAPTITACPSAPAAMKATAATTIAATAPVASWFTAATAATTAPVAATAPTATWFTAPAATATAPSTAPAATPATTTATTTAATATPAAAAPTSAASASSPYPSSPTRTLVISTPQRVMHQSVTSPTMITRTLQQPWQNQKSDDAATLAFPQQQQNQQQQQQQHQQHQQHQHHQSEATATSSKSTV